jgi:hypothetical protein
MGGSLHLHKQLTERHIDYLGLLEYDFYVCATPRVLGFFMEHRIWFKV